MKAYRCHTEFTVRTLFTRKSYFVGEHITEEKYDKLKPEYQLNFELVTKSAPKIQSQSSPHAPVSQSTRYEDRGYDYNRSVQMPLPDYTPPAQQQDDTPSFSGYGGGDSGGGGSTDSYINDSPSTDFGGGDTGGGGASGEW